MGAQQVPPQCLTLDVLRPLRHQHPTQKQACLLSLLFPKVSLSHRTRPHSRLDGLPHQQSVITVEVVGNVLRAVHAPGLDGLREAQGGIGQVLDSPLHHLHVPATPGGIGLVREQSA